MYKRFVKAWKAETPAIWKSARNIAGFIALAVPSMAGISATIPGVSVPEWFNTYSWYLMAGAGLITLYAGTRQRKKK